MRAPRPTLSVRVRRLARRARRAFPSALSLLLAFALLFVDLRAALPPDAKLEIPNIQLPNGLLLSTRAQLELQRLNNEVAKLGPQEAAVQSSNPPFSHYWQYTLSTTRALPSDDGYATFYLKETSTLYVGTITGSPRRSERLLSDLQLHRQQLRRLR